MLFYFIFFGFVVTILILQYLTAKYDHWKIRNIAGPKPVLLFGNIKDTVIRKENSAETLKKIYDAYPNEPVVGFFRMTSPCLLVRDLDIIKNIMIKDFDCFEDRGVEFSKEGLGANLFHADGETWRALRYKFTPMFTTSKLKSMIYLINEKCDKFISFVENATVQQSEQEMYYHFKRYTVSTILSCAFGLTVDTMSESLMETFAEIDKLTVNTNIAHEIDMMFPGLFKYLNLSIFPQKVQTFFKDMVSTVIKERDGKPSNRNDFMDLMLEMREQLTIDAMAAQAFVFYVGGYETSSSVLVFMLYELSRNPEVQEKVLEEVDNVLNKHNGEITYDTLCDLSYLENVLKETYRMYPIVPLLRKSKTDYKVPGTKITIEKDTVIVISPCGIHFDAKYFLEPEKFDPDRWTAENSKNLHPCAYLPYGVGPRNCIGIRFSKLQTRICALRLLSKFRVAPSKKTPKIVIDPERLLVNPAGGVYLELIPRITKS